MDRHLAINVYDADENAVPHAEVTFKVKSQGRTVIIGPLETQGVKDHPVSVQIPDLGDPVIEVTATFQNYTNTVLVDTRQKSFAILTLDFSQMTSSDGEHNKGVALNPLQILNMARQAVPAVNYALGVAGIAAAGAIITLFTGQNKASIILIALVAIGMVMLFVFSQLVTAKSRSVQHAGVVLVWAVLLFFITFLLFTVTAFAGQWPPAWAKFLGVG